MIGKLIKKIEGATYENSVWDYWLFFELKNQQIVKIFDSTCLSAKMEELKSYNIELTSSMIFPEIDGYESTVFFGQILQVNDELQFVNESLNIQVTENNNLVFNQPIYVTIGRIDLKSIEYVT